MKLIWKILIALGIVLVLLVGGFSIWAYTPSQPMPEAIQAMQSNADVTVSRDGWVTFAPKNGQPTTGIIFYPGGRVDYRAYAPLASALAKEGNLVVLVPMPFNLAVFGVNKANEVIAAYPEIERWYIGGHSLGGAMAASHVFQNPGKVDGLILLAAYPASNQSLADTNLPVLSISASQDGLATPEKIQASRALLPASTVFYEIIGGDHAQFGWYGPQSGDNPARIIREEQQKIIQDQILKFIQTNQSP
jgi:pimeloyl-ACP methyl ester carboxylesterase